MDDVLKEMCRPSVELKVASDFGSQEDYERYGFDNKGLKTGGGKIRKPSSAKGYTGPNGEVSKTTVNRSPLKRVDCQSYTNYPQWLAKQPPEYQKGILGPKAYAKYKETGDLRTALGFTGASTDTWKPTKKSEAGVTVRDRNTLKPLSAAEKKRFDKDGYETLWWDAEDASDFTKAVRDGIHGEEAVALVDKYDITDRELAGIHAYTENYFNDINPLLREGGPLGKHELPVRVIENGLSKLPAYDGDVVRKMITSDIEEIAAKYQVGGTFEDKGFLSTSSSTESDFFGGDDEENVTFHIVGKHSGKGISHIAGIPGEEEVLFAPGAKFEILSVDDRIVKFEDGYEEQRLTITMQERLATEIAVKSVTKPVGLTKKDIASFDNAFEELLLEQDKDEEVVAVYTSAKSKGGILISKYSLTDEEAVSIRGYTGEYYQVINPLLRDVAKGKDTLDQHSVFSKAISSGLSKLPAYDGDVIRKIQLKGETVDSFLSKYEVGSSFKSEGYLSTSSSADSSTFSKHDNVTYIIKGKHKGKDISSISGIPQEAEILFDKGAEFEVLSSINTKDGIVIEMKQKTTPAATTIVPQPVAKAIAKVELAPELDAETIAAIKREEAIFDGSIDRADMTDDERKWSDELFGITDEPIKETADIKKVLEENTEKAFVKLADLQEEEELSKTAITYDQKLSADEMREFKQSGYEAMGVDPKKPTNRIKTKVKKLRKQGLTIAEAVTVSTYDNEAYEKLNSAILSGEPLSKEMEMQARVLTVANKKLAKKGVIVTDIATAPSAADLKDKIKEAEIAKDKADEALLEHKVDTGEIDAKERAKEVKAGTIAWEDMTKAERDVFDEEFDTVGGKEPTVEGVDKLGVLKTEAAIAYDDFKDIEEDYDAAMEDSDLSKTDKDFIEDEYLHLKGMKEKADKELSDYRAKDKEPVSTERKASDKAKVALTKAEAEHELTKAEYLAISKDYQEKVAAYNKYGTKETKDAMMEVSRKVGEMTDELEKAKKKYTKVKKEVGETTLAASIAEDKLKKEKDKEIETMARKLAKAEATFDKEHDIGAEMELLEIKADAEALVEKRGLDKDYFKAKRLKDRADAAMDELEAASDAYSAEPSENAVAREEKAKVDLKKAEYELDQYRSLSSSDAKLAAATKAKMEAKEAKDRADTVLRVESKRLEDIEEALFEPMPKDAARELEEYAEEVRDSLMEAKTGYDETSRLYDLAYLEEEKAIGKSGRPRQATIPSFVHTEVEDFHTGTQDKALSKITGMTDSSGYKFTQKRIDDWVDKELEGIKNSYVHTRVDSQTTLEAILESGRFKTQFETGASKGMYDPDRRIIAEENMFGLPTNLSPQDRPYYGYLTDVKNGYLNEKKYVDQYGDISITFKSSIKERTTWTGEDSLNEALYGDNSFTPSSVLNPKRESLSVRVASHVKAGVIDKGKPMTGLDSRAYIEAQMFGGVSVSDIDTVYFSEKPNTRLKRMLDEAGIDYEVVEKY